MRMRLLTAVWFLLLAACHAPGAPGTPVGYDDFERASAEPAPGFVAGQPANDVSFAKANRGEGGPGGRRLGLDPRAGDPSATPPASDRMLVYRGEIRVEVARPEDAGRAFLAQVMAWGGYLQSQQGATWTVRLPAQRFDEALAALLVAGRVLDESRQANDVTEEFLDLGIRLDTARKSRERLLEVLAKAEKVEDILKVEAELRRLTEEIERMEGRRKYLADQVALATLSATFQAIAQAPPPPPRPKQRSRFPWINRVGADAMMGGF